jgi:hypothetical protein
MTYVFIGSKTQLFDIDTRKSFQNRLNIKTLFELYLFWINRIVWNLKPDGPVFVTSSLWLDFPLSCFFDALLPLSMLQTPLDLQIFKFSFFLDLTLKLS